MGSGDIVTSIGKTCIN